MVGGQITLSGISDKGIELIIEARDSHPGLILNQGQLTGASGSANATLSWRDVDGLKALAEVLEKLATLL
jgi:hypothetical protein